MNDRKLIAQSLLEIAKKSETTFLEFGKEDEELILAAKKIGIIIPSPDLLVMKTVYAEINKVNLNKVILPKEAVEKGLNTLIGKQCNWEHLGSGSVCGYTISAKINGDTIETINVLFKSLFPEQSEELKAKMKSKEAAVSFEIYSIDPTTEKSVIRELANGNREISPILFSGTGVLLLNPPACPKAKIFKIVANKELTETKKIETNIFNQNLVYAQLAIEEPKCAKCGVCSCKNEGGDKKKMAELEKKEEVIVEAKKKDGDECDMGEGKKGELHIDAEGHESCMTSEAHKKMHEEMMKSSTETKPVTEAAGSETKVENKETPVKEPEKAKTEEATVVTTTTETKVVDDMQEKKEVITIKENVSQEVIHNDGSKSTETKETTQIRTYTYEEVQAEVAKVKKEEEDKLAIKDTEIANLKSELEKQKIEKDKEISTLKQELGNKDQEIAKLTPKVEPETKPQMEVGSVGIPEDAIEARARRIDEKITKKRKA